MLTPRYWIRAPRRAFVDTIGLSKLVARFLNRELAKGQTMSDWSVRLNGEQLKCGTPFPLASPRLVRD